MSIASTLDAISSASALTGVKRAFGDPPESINEFPATIVYVTSGEFGLMTGRAFCPKMESVFVLELYLARQELPSVIAAASLWPEPILEALRASQLEIVYPIRWTMGPLRYNNGSLFGLRFLVTVKE